MKAFSEVAKIEEFLICFKTHLKINLRSISHVARFPQEMNEEANLWNIRRGFLASNVHQCNLISREEIPVQGMKTL